MRGIPSESQPQAFPTILEVCEMKLSRLKRTTLVFSLCLLIAAISIILNPTVRAANPATG